MSASEPDPADQPTEGDEAPTEVREPKTEPLPVEPKPDAEAGDRLPRGRRYAVRTLLVLGTIIGIVALLAVWVNRQALNADNWANTSSSLLENKEVRTQVSNYVVDQVYQNVNVTTELEKVLPKQLDPLAGTAAGQLQGLATEAVNALLERPFVQQAWKESNRLSMQQLINIVEEKQGGVVESSDGAINLNLRPLITTAIDKLGLSSQLASKVPADAGSVKIFSSDDISAVQSYAKLLRGLGIVLPILAFLLYALALFVAKGRRRKTLIEVGINLIAAGAIVLVVAVVAKGQVVDALASTDSVKPAVEAVWDIATQMLRDIAWATIITAIPLILAALLAGPSEWAVATRRFLAPWLRHQVGVAYGVVAVVLILLIVWGPLHWMQEPIPVLLMIALVVVGVELLRRQTAREYPDAEMPDAGAALSAHAKRLSGSMSDAARKGQQAMSDAVASRKSDASGENADAGVTPAAVAAAGVASAAAAEAPTAVTPSPAGDDRLAQLERLGTLRDRGILDDEEFAEQKRQILGQSS